jgi:regulatory protein
MPIITSLTVQTKNKNRCNLFLDGEFFAGISTETAMKNRLKVGMEVDEKFVSEVILESEKNQALAKATEYITKYLKTKYQVKDYIVRKGYSEEIAWYCVDKLKEYNYIDDIEYSKRFIESQSKNNGKKMLEYKLMMKGVKKQDIDDAYSGVEINEK